MNFLDRLLEKNILPDAVVRFGIRRFLTQRLRDESARYDRAAYAEDLRRRPLAEQTTAANEQHYEVPTRFYQLCLGRRLKYSCCFYPTGRETLDQAEEAMLALYAERAQIADGQDILELGCGWGSLTLYLAERFPRARLTAMSNSHTQKAHIDAALRQRGLTNVTTITCDINAFQPAPAHFDRVVSVEMFEHLKNYEQLFALIARALRPDGLLFVHIFTHRQLSYHFVVRDASDWMTRHFFTGGQLPAHDLLLQFQNDLQAIADWTLDGTHYQRTATHWLQNMEAHRAEIMPLFAANYGAEHAEKWWAYWRIFYLTTAEMWGFRRGTEWQLSHYLFRKP